MNKGFTFLVAIFLVLVVDLFQWEPPQSTYQDLSDNLVTNAQAASKNSIPGFNFVLGRDTDFRFRNSDGASSVTKAPVSDPVTMLLFASGLIGLVGLGRKKG